MAAAFDISRIGIEVNLPVGSNYDILLVSTPDGYPKGQVLFKFEGTPRKVEGIQKVAQTFIRMLFTQKGTDLLYPSLGTKFSELTIGANRTSTDAQFRSEITSAIRDGEAQTKYVLNSATGSLTGQLQEIKIQGFYTSKDSLSLYLQVLTKAGELASISVPFPQLDLKISG